MDLNLDGKKALVTGSTAGTGFAIARTLAREGAPVVFTGRTQDRVNNAVNRIQQELGDVKASGVAADLATSAALLCGSKAGRFFNLISSIRRARRSRPTKGVGSLYYEISSAKFRCYNGQLRVFLRYVWQEVNR